MTNIKTSVIYVKVSKPYTLEEIELRLREYYSSSRSLRSLNKLLVASGSQSLTGFKLFPLRLIMFTSVGRVVSHEW